MQTIAWVFYTESQPKLLATVKQQNALSFSARRRPGRETAQGLPLETIWRGKEDGVDFLTCLERTVPGWYIYQGIAHHH